jgi:LPXTG-motif cell wall-anchored protein
MARVVMFAYVLLAGLATPALLFAAGSGESTSPPGATGAQATDPGTPTPAAPPTTTTSPSAPPPAPAAAPSPAAPTAQAAPAAAAPPVRAHPRRTPVLAAAQPVKVRAVARAAGGDTISDFKFTPSTITVTAGDSVTWTNNGPAGHSATADDGSFDTGVLRKGTSGSHTFTQAGTYTFHCTPHPFMTGKVVVVAASSGGGGSSGGSSSASGSGSSAGAAAGSGASSSDTGSSTADSGGSSNSSLPNTGADVGAVALLGAMLVGGGMVLRRRVAEDG